MLIWRTVFRILAPKCVTGLPSQWAGRKALPGLRTATIHFGVAMAAQRRDERFMRAALKEAQKGIGQTSPNPAVGAVLVVADRIVAKGHHRGAGHEHAEVECLSAFGAVHVRDGILAEECTHLNEGFNKWIITGRPFVIAKCGMSLDGRLTRPPSEPRWITSSTARRHAHELRTRVDAVLIGAETLRVDNPRLTVRGMRHGRQPWRVVLTRSGNLPPRAYLFSDRQAARTLVYKRKRLAAVLEDLGKKNLTSVLIEGGGEVLGQALDGRLIDKIQLYLGPMLTGGPVIAFAGRGTGITANAIRLDRVSYRRIGQNICITAYPCPVFAE